jgi:hypothetical protein
VPGVHAVQTADPARETFRKNIQMGVKKRKIERKKEKKNE